MGVEAMSETAWDGGERRRACDAHTLQIAREAARVAAREVLNSLTPHDLDTKEGQEAFRATIAHADTLRLGCAGIKRVAGATAVRTVVGAVVLAAIWILWDTIRPHVK